MPSEIRPRMNLLAAQWLWLTIPVMLICLALVFTLAWSLVKNHRSSLVVSVPLAAEQMIELDATGPMLLHGEGPRMTSAFGKLDFQMTGADAGLSVPLEGILFKSKSSGASRARLSLRRFTCESPGRYRLTVSGEIAPERTANHNLVITRDNRTGMTATIVGLVFSAIGTFLFLGLTIMLFIVNR